MKDYFSGHSKLYAAFRPTYPDELYSFLFRHVKHFDSAWDCATGNGQVAHVLAKKFKQVQATDISQQQLDQAVQAENIFYSAQSAEKTNFQDEQFDLITVGQAMHWFDTEKFYAEVKRVAKKDAVLAVWGYAICSVNTEIDKHFNHFYNHVVGPYWDSARKLVEEEYKSVPFPFAQIETPKFFIKTEWTLEEFTGYLRTWSATQKFIKDKNYNPVPEIAELLKPLWNEKEVVSFPVFMKLGRVN
jgi:SAM-dependent methyltransferase